MTNPATKTLSPSELAKLEHAFATDPSSDAYRPLAEAYLAMGRFMEAMVVCKKGVKAHPTLPEARLLLARVYLEQGKERKALDELLGALQIAPGDKSVLRTTGEIQIKVGEAEPGKANLLKAYQVDPQDSETLAAMSRCKVEVPKAAAPQPRATAAPAQAQEQHPVASAQTARRASSTGLRKVAPPMNEVVAPGAPRSGNGANGSEVLPQSARTAWSARSYTPAGSIEDVTSDRLRPVHRPSTRLTLTFLLLLVIPLAAGSYWLIGRWKAQRNREIKKHLALATEQLRHDSYESYKRACAAADKVLELDANSTAAHGYLAYAYAVRWGEHGGGDEARKLAEEHLESAKKGRELSSHMYAADALIKVYSGKGAAALRDLEQRVKAFDAENKKSSLMYLTLGLIQMNQGDLEHARESLEAAQGLAPDDARIYAALGTLYRRRGQDQEAWKNFDFALRYERDHPDSLLGKALLILQQDRPEYPVAAKMIRKLTEAEPPPSPRQLATAHLLRALLISRVSQELPEYKPDYQRQLAESTGVPLDKSKAQAEMARTEEAGFTLDRQNPELRLIKGRRLISEGRIDAAIAEVRAAIRMDSTRSHFYVELARAMMLKPGGEKEAQEALISALKNVQNSPKLLVMLGNAYRRQGKLDEALAQYARAVSDPKARNPEARLAMGGIYRERKDYPKAIEVLEKATQEFVGQPSRIAAAYAELGRALEEKGDRVKADEIYQKALNADEDYSPSYFYYARFLAGDGRQAGKARTTAQEYLKRDPKGEFASEAQRLAQ
ncbi:MAG TPA: tetratricopeptide repeat protein [Myxococcaceae bacterium]|nr:tetratricopeptide repeat protein [Myxococcaceae bacterium]